MNAITEITAALPAHARTRTDGWTAERQRAFLEAIAAGHTVDAAARAVGMTKQSAYALRNRAAGAAFAVGWAAAGLIAREHIADTLLTRAIDGQVETYTRADGTEITRHRYDNRLAATLLARLDRMVESAQGPEAHAARLAAREFDAYLDLVEHDAGPARAGLFLARRARREDDPELDSIVALARADRWLRTGAGTTDEIDVADLDPAERAGWSAEQWARAEAAGLIAVAAPPAPPLPRDGQVGQLREKEKPAPEEEEEEVDPPVWWCPDAGDWFTIFAPPPLGFVGKEYGSFGDDDYQRELTPEERMLMETARTIDHVALCTAHAPEREAWFAAIAAGIEGKAPPLGPDDILDLDALIDLDAQDAGDDGSSGDGGDGNDEGDDGGKDDAAPEAPDAACLQSATKPTI